MDSDIDEMLELMELAVTWGELDYSGELVIPPTQWLDFLDRHEWRDADRAVRIFTLATDIALRSSGYSGQDLRGRVTGLLTAVPAG